MWYNEALRTVFQIVLIIVIEGINGDTIQKPPLLILYF